jgi:hypothetical protein
MFEDRLKQFQELDNYEKSNLSHQNQLSEEKQRRNILQRNLYLSIYFYLEEKSVDTSNGKYASIQPKQNFKSFPGLRKMS